MKPDDDRQFERFDAGQMPLDGLRLIEASAGTGKTFSLAGLYLRLLLEQWLSVREILVMTFTRAATQELRERIRARLAQAARLAVDPDSADADNTEQQFALDIINKVATRRGRDAIATHLRESAARMDEATICTIHRFAQQAAAENAFDSALPFDRGEQVDDGPLHQEVIADYWRGQVIGRAGHQAQAFLQLWSDPEALAKDLGPVLQKAHVQLVGPTAKVITEKTEQTRQLWQKEQAALAKLLEQAEEENACFKNKGLDKVMAAAGGAAGLMEQLDSGLAGTSEGHAGLPDWISDMADAESIAKHIKKKPAKDWFHPQNLALVQALAELQALGRLAALRAALASVREEALERKRARRQYSFNDMITGLHEAIHSTDSGDALADSLHRTWPWALVDEFQDTDPLQYAILKRIYARRDRGGLLMIGDPKQAIYGFRGGDVFAYLQASGDATARYSLDTNFRSTANVLSAVETVFRAGGEQAFVIDRIHFQSVNAGRRDGDRIISRDAQPLPAMTLWQVDDAASKQDAEGDLIDAAVHQIHELLDGNTLIVSDNKDEAEQTLKPADIAVLVNTNAQAADMQRALSRRGIAAVCLHQKSVFASEEALDMLRLLRAVATPADEDALRAALATPLLGQRMGDLIRLAQEEQEWQANNARFQSAHERWRQAGVLAMLRPLLQEEAPRLLAHEDGERRMTNYLQLAELLQQASGEQFGFAGLIRWLEEAIQSPSSDSGDADEQQLRLESDDALIRIATVHKVKGLQYRIVLLPFAPLLGAMGSDKPPFLYHDDRGQACLDFNTGTHADAQQRAVAENRAEAIRLLYVALTRAEQACYLPWGPINTAQNGALAWLLHQADGADARQRFASTKPPAWLNAETTAQRLNELAAASGGCIEVRPLPAPLSEDAPRPASTPPEGQARSDWPAARRPWSVFSFSRLIRGASHAMSSDTGGDDEAPDEQLADVASGELHLRGATFGTAVHDILENADFTTWPGPDDDLGNAEMSLIENTLMAAGLPLPDGKAHGTLLKQVGLLISRCLHTPIDGIGPLAALPPGQRVAEMEFILGLGGSRTGDIMKLIQSHGYGGDLPEARQRQLLEGLMHGYIDLTVEADGRYYVIDYKSNDLGPDQRHYRGDALKQAVHAAHYDLQYLIYTVALHRHLGKRLPGYDPEKHLGGVRYLFLRGMTGEDKADGVFSDSPPVALVRALDALFAGQRLEPEQASLL